MKLKILVLVAVMAMSATGSAQAYEKWECYHFSKPQQVLVTAEIIEPENGFNGAITAAGERQLASYGVQGLDRRWDFGNNLNYSFTIDVKGAGEYYDFSNIDPGKTTQASMVLDCVHVSTP